MNSKLMISCPQCDSGKSKHFQDTICDYCNGTKKINIFDHYKILNITDERFDNVKTFAENRFLKYDSSSRMR